MLLTAGTGAMRSRHRHAPEQLQQEPQRAAADRQAQPPPSSGREAPRDLLLCHLCLYSCQQWPAGVGGRAALAQPGER